MNNLSQCWYVNPHLPNATGKVVKDILLKISFLRQQAVNA